MADPSDSRASPCARCAVALGRSCCEAGPDEPLATLTRADVARLEAFDPKARSGVEEELLSEAEAATYVQRRPSYAGYFQANTRRLTLRKRAGACVFFVAGSGCGFPEEVRPTACRLYPFEPSAADDFTLAVDAFPSLAEARSSGDAACLAVQEARDWPELMRAFGTSRTALRVLASRLREEVRAHPPTPERARAEIGP